MTAFAFLLLTCQLRQEGEGCRLVKPANRWPNHARGLALRNADRVTGAPDKHNNDT